VSRHKKEKCGQHLCRSQSLPKTRRRCWPILIQHHPGFFSHRINFSQTKCDFLPEDGLLSNIPTVDADYEDSVISDEGAITKDILDQPQLFQKQQTSSKK
jgi:hypothetical protein